MLNMGIVDFSTDMYSDGNHLNFTGAAKVTQRLGNYISTNYDLHDYSKNEHWLEDHREYFEYKIDKIDDTNSLYDKLLACYGSDFDVNLILRKDCKLYDHDRYIRTYMDNLGWYGTVRYKDSISLNETECDVLLEIYDNKTMELVHTAAYNYSDQSLKRVG